MRVMGGVKRGMEVLTGVLNFLVWVDEEFGLFFLFFIFLLASFYFFALFKLKKGVEGCFFFELSIFPLGFVFVSFSCA